jgi:hypothetical protein
METRSLGLDDSMALHFVQMPSSDRKIAWVNPVVHRILHEVTMRFVGVISQVSIGVQKNRINPDLDGMYDPSLLDLGAASVGFRPLQKDQTAVTRAFDSQVRPRRLSAAVLDMSSSHIRQKP